MHLPAGVLLQGVVIGSLDGLLALGLVLLWQSGRFVSFAQGQLGALAAVVGIAVMQRFSAPLGVAVVVALAVGLAVAAASELVVVRRLFDAPRLVLTVATIGLAEVYGALTLLVPKMLGGNLTPLFTIDLGLRFRVGPVDFGGGAVAVLILAPAVVMGLAFFLRTAAGSQLRAAADNPGRAQSLGLRVRRVSTSAWVVAGLLAAVTGLLRAAVVGFGYGVLAGPDLLLPALAAAVLGGWGSPWRTFGAAVGLGVVQEAVRWNVDRPGVTSLVLLVAILVGLAVQRRSHGRSQGADEPGHVLVRPVPVRPIPWRAAALGLAGVLALPLMLSPSQLDLATVTALLGVVAVSLTLLTGWAGQVSLGQWGIVAVGAAGGAVLVEGGVPFPVALLVMAAVGAAVAMAVGLPAVGSARGIAGGLPLAIATLAFAVVTDEYLLRLSFLTPPHDPRRPPAVRGLGPYYEVCAVALVVAVALAAWLRRSPAGLSLLAARDNPDAAAATGIRPDRARLWAFAASGLLAGSAGFLYAFQRESLFGAFGPERSLQVFTIVVIGGLGSLPGALLGVLYVSLVQDYLSATWQPLATGAGLLVLLLLLPEGLGGVLARLRVWRRPRTGPAARTGVMAAGPRPRTPPPSPPALLSVRGLAAGYGGRVCVADVDLDVGPGQLVALLGANGSGKSTLLRALAGVVVPAAGQVLVDRVDVTQLGVPERVAAGVVLAPAGRLGVFPGLTVGENLRLAARVRSGEVAAALERVPGLGSKLTQRAGSLSGGEQQLLALAQTLVRRPQVLLVDELSMGLAAEALAALMEVLTDLRAAGTGVLVAEQALDVVQDVSDEVLFLERGRVELRGPPAALADRADLLRPVFL